MTQERKNTLRAMSRGIGAKFFNQKVKDRYEGNQDLLDTCLIQDFDTIPEIIYKQLTFFLTLENYTPIIEEKVYLRNKIKNKNTSPTPWMVLHFGFKEKHIVDPVTKERKNLGHRRMQCHNIDLNKISHDELKKVFDGYTFYYGDHWVGYNFTNSREIKLKHVESRAKAIDLIEKFSLFTIPEFQQEGKIEDNIFDITPPKNRPQPDNYKLTGHLFKITVHEQQGSRTTLVHSTMIANNRR